jgi:hypothetical protein
MIACQAASATTLLIAMVVITNCTSRAWSLLVGTGASALKDSISTPSLYNFSPSLSLRVEYTSSSMSSLLMLWSSSCSYCSSIGVRWAVGIPSTTSSISKGSSSWDACYGASCCGSYDCGKFRGSSGPPGWWLVLMRTVWQGWTIYHLERGECEKKFKEPKKIR